MKTQANLIRNYMNQSFTNFYYIKPLNFDLNVLKSNFLGVKIYDKNTGLLEARLVFLNQGYKYKLEIFNNYVIKEKLHINKKMVYLWSNTTHGAQVDKNGCIITDNYNNMHFGSTLLTSKKYNNFSFWSEGKEFNINLENTEVALNQYANKNTIAFPIHGEDEFMNKLHHKNDKKFLFNNSINDVFETIPTKKVIIMEGLSDGEVQEFKELCKNLNPEISIYNIVKNFGVKNKDGLRIIDENEFYNLTYQIKQYYPLKGEEDNLIKFNDFKVYEDGIKFEDHKGEENIIEDIVGNIDNQIFGFKKKYINVNDSIKNGLNLENDFDRNGLTIDIKNEGLTIIYPDEK